MKRIPILKEVSKDNGMYIVTYTKGEYTIAVGKDGTLCIAERHALNQLKEQGYRLQGL